jgi:signal peptidase I
MLPTYKSGELVIIHKLNSLGENWKPQKGQVIVAVDPKDGEKITKRVIGLEGEYVIIKNGYIYINDKKHEDPYTYQNITYWTEPEEIRATKPKDEWLFLNTDQDVGLIPIGYLWVIGDNRNMSWYGLIKIEDIEGLVLF